MGLKLLHLLNGLVTLAVTICLVTAAAYAGYALWDNQQIYDNTESVISEMKEIRDTIDTPTMSAMEQLIEESRTAREAEAAISAMTAEQNTGTEASADRSADIPAAQEADPQENGQRTVPETSTVKAGTEPQAESAAGESGEAVPASAAEEKAEQAEEQDDSPFAQLKKINPDITAWISIPGTAIDYPVMQGTSNYSYINTDVYGNFALAGSIFLDSRNDGEYGDLYSLLYGHNMSQHRMFSDVNLYKDEEFFNGHRLGLLILPDGCHILESLSVILTPASNSGLFNPENWAHLDAEAVLRTVREDAMFLCEDGMQALEAKLEAGETPRIVSLSTCSDEFTDARTILLTLMDP